MQYQILLFVPAFYLALWVAQEKVPGTRSVLLRNLFLSAVLFLCLILPLWYFFLKTQYFDFSRKIEWAFGPAREFVLDWNTSRNLWEQAAYAVRFFLGNLFVVFESKTAFVPEAAAYFRFFSYTLFGFFLLGGGALLTSPDRRARSLGVFVGATLITWWGLAAFRPFPFGPSRHTLILLPLFAVVAAEGAWAISGLVAVWVQKKMPRVSPGGILIGMGVIVLIFFAIHFREFLAERKSPVSENEIVKVLQAFDPDEIFYDKRGFHLEYIRDFREVYKKIKAKPVEEIKTFAFLTRYPDTSIVARCQEYQEVRQVVAWAEKKKNPAGAPSRVFLRPCRDFQVVYEKKLESDVSEGFSRKVPVNNLANRLYFYVLSVDPEKKKLAPQFGGKA
jgi:hypothetical protein